MKKVLWWIYHSEWCRVGHLCFNAQYWFGRRLRRIDYSRVMSDLNKH